MKEEKQKEKNTDEIIKDMYTEKKSVHSPKERRKNKGGSTLNNNVEDEKYLQEMYEMVEYNERRNNIIVLALAISFFALLGLSLFLNFSSLHASKKLSQNTVHTEKNETLSENKQTTTKTTEDLSTTNTTASEENLNDKIGTYLSSKENQKIVFDRAVTLNKGSDKGITGYLLAEILREQGVNIPESTCNTEQLLKTLTDLGWKKHTDVTELKKGDICFTTDMPEKPGIPGHAYIFMDWVQAGKTDYANIVDGQVNEFKSIYHKRNIDISTPEKDKFNFFLRK